MPYTAEEARRRLLNDLAVAVEQMAIGLACLTAAYERLDERASDELERQLFRPVQLAYGRARRTYSEFAQRYGLAGREFAQASPGLESQGPRELLEKAADALRGADDAIAALQDSMLPVEVGDTE